MEYGQIFHVTRIGKYYCKNMKYRIIVHIYPACTQHERGYVIRAGVHFYTNIPYSGYFSGGKIFVDARICSDSW